MHSESELTHVFRPAGRTGPDSYRVIALPQDPVHVKLCVHPPRAELLFSQSCGTQATLAFKAKCSGGFSMSYPQAGEPQVGFRTLSIRELL